MGVYIPAGYSSGRFLPCPHWAAGRSGLWGERIPSCPPVPHCWKLATRHACWPFLSQSHNPRRSLSQLSRGPAERYHVEYFKYKHWPWVWDTQITSLNQINFGQFHVIKCTILNGLFSEFGQSTQACTHYHNQVLEHPITFFKKYPILLVFTFFILPKYRSSKEFQSKILEYNILGLKIWQFSQRNGPLKAI